MGKGREVSPFHCSALRRTVTPTAGPRLGEWHPKCTSHSELSNRAVARDRGGRLVPPAHLGQGSPPRSCTAAFTSALWCRGPSSLSSISPPSATARVHSWPHPAAREIVPRGTSDGLATLRKALQGPPLNSAPARCSRGDLASHAPLLSRVLANPVVSVLGPSQAAPRPQMWGVPLRPTESGRGLSVAPFLTPSGLFVRQPPPRRPLPSFRVLCRMYQLPT